MSRFATGVTVISTTDAKGSPYGITVNAFSSLSLEPPLVQWSLARSAHSWPIFHDAEYFAVNILAAGQEEVSRNFTRPIDRFAAARSEGGLHGLRLVADCAAWIECRKVDELPGGDHVIFVGVAERCRVFDRQPLIVWRSLYFDMDRNQLSAGEADVF